MTTQTVISALQDSIESNLFIPAKFLEQRTGCNERRLRKLVELIRREDLATGYILISSDLGYKLSNDSTEIETWVRLYLSECFTRIKTVKAAKKFLKQEVSSQLSLELNF